MVISLLGCLLFSLTFCVAHQQLYILNNHIRTNFTKLSLLPYSGIQECIEACNIDENCCAFGVKSRMSIDQIDCYISNGRWLQELDAAVEILVKFDKEELLINERRAMKTKTDNCSSPFVEFGDIPGCYYPAVNEYVAWQEAEDAWKALDPRAHLIGFDSLEVRYLNLKSIKLLKICLIILGQWINKIWLYYKWTALRAACFWLNHYISYSGTSNCVPVLYRGYVLDGRKRPWWRWSVNMDR